jgi:uncharacterized protein YndB with AHSA1/START domain
MNDHGVVTEAGTVRFERLLPGPIERVWSYLTESDKRGTWFASGPMELRVGGRVELRFHHADLSPHAEEPPAKYKKYENGVTTHGRITRCEPPRLLSFTWGGEADESEVTFELTPRGKEVQLILTHRRLADRAAMVSVSSGWHSHLEVLADLLNGRVPGPFWPKVTRFEAEYEKRLASK